MNPDAAIIGGGTGGAFTGSRLARIFPAESVAIVEPSEVHYYQPLWTLVGGGIIKKEETARPMSSIIPKGVNWIKENGGEHIELSPSGYSFTDTPELIGQVKEASEKTGIELSSSISKIETVAIKGTRKILKYQNGAE